MRKRRLQNEHGAAAVEFTLIALLLFSIVFGIIEFGVLMFNEHILTNASREGARAGVVMRSNRLTDQDIEKIVNDYCKNYMVSFGASSVPKTIVSPAETSRVGLLFGTELVVTVTYPFKFLVLSSFGLDPITLKAETRMRME